MIHRRILDVAASDPEASLAAIADEVSGASPDLVERVLDEYGDPCRDATADDHDADPQDGDENNTDPTSDDTEPASGDSDQMSDQIDPTPEEIDPASDDTSPTAASDPDRDDADPDGHDGGPEVDETGPGADDADPASNRPDPASDDADPASDDPDPTVASLTDKQRRTLRALYERPEASQGDLAEDLDVTRATVCRRLNAIPGFEWSDRHEFAESVFGDDSGADPDEPAADPNDGPAEGGGAATQAETGTTGSVPDDAAAPLHERDATVEGDGGRPDRGAGSPDDDAAESETDSESSADGEDQDGSERAVAPDRRSGPDGRSEPDGSAPLDDVRSTVAALDERVEALETRVNEVDQGPSERRTEPTTGAPETGAAAGSLPPELAHKVVHACMESDRVTEDEELDVLRTFMQG